MSAARTNILIVDDDDDVLLAGMLLLKKHFAGVFTERNPQRLPALLGEKFYHLVLLDMNFGPEARDGAEGLHWLAQICERSPQTQVIMLTAFGEIDLAVNALKLGAADFLLKPWDNARLLATVNAHISPVGEASAKPKAPLPLPDGNVFLGRSPAMQRVFQIIEKVAPTDANVLITGENGTGKELVARALHQQSARAGKPLVTVDMGAIPETLFESELFGHVRGAFTDARDDKPGRFEQAHKGTLFLDEISNLPLPLQAKLLHALQSRKVQRLGATRTTDIDIRLIAATNRPLVSLVQQQLFRQDLLYRINTVEIRLPPLRERAEDILLLAGHYQELYEKRYKCKFKPLTANDFRALEGYSWPGNVRELQHAVERAVILSEGNELNLADALGQTGEPEVLPLAGRASSTDLGTLEKTTILHVLQSHNGNISRAARELGLTRAALYRRLEKYGIQ